MSERAPSVRVLWDEGGLLAIDKPSGFESTGRTPTDPGGMQHHVAAWARRPVWLVHQLDRETSGVLLLVRRRSLVAPWQARLRERSTRKRYVAIVRGAPERARTLRHALAYDRKERRWTVRSDGKPAVTHVSRIARGGGRALLELTLETGRTHQARVHLAHEGWPLIGERRYVTPPDASHPRHALHLHAVECAAAPSIVSPLPEDLLSLARDSGFEADAAAYAPS